MQRVSAFLPSWERRASASTKPTSGPPPAVAKRVSSTGGIANSFWGWGARAAAPPSDTIGSKKVPNINVAAANSGSRVQREAFWPATLDLECDKAARILKSFCGTQCSIPPPQPRSAPSRLNSNHDLQWMATLPPWTPIPKRPTRNLNCHLSHKRSRRFQRTSFRMRQV